MYPFSEFGNLYRSHGAAGSLRAIARRFRPKLPRIESEFIKWLRFANAGMLLDGNVDAMDYAIRNLPGEMPIIEIGSFCGLSTNVIGHLLEKHARRNQFFTCDKWEFEGAEDGTIGDSWITHADYKLFIRETFLRNVRRFSSICPHTVEAFSDEFFALWKRDEVREDVFGRLCRLGGPISFAYIDGDHTYEFAKRDFENCDRHLAIGGFILFDDSGDGSPWEVCRVIREVLATNRYKVVAANPNYLLRKR